MERGLENVFIWLLKRKKNMNGTSLYEAIFSSIYEQSKFQLYSSVKFRCVEIVLNTVPTKASSCFVLISGLFDETRMYYTSKKRSHDLSEDKKQRCLNFQKFTHTCFKFYIKRVNHSIYFTDPKMLVQNMRLTQNT